MLKNEDGAVSVLFALSMAFLLGFAALSADVAMVHLKKAEMQNAADAGALAGAQDLPNAGNAISKAKDFAELNGAERSNITVTTPYNGDDTKIQVVVTAENVPHFFASIWGNTETDVPARAVAEKITTGPSGPAIFSGSSCEPLIIDGRNITVIGGAHTNHRFVADGRNISVEGAVTAVKGSVLDGRNIDIPDLDDSADYISLADFAASIGLDPGLVDTERAAAQTINGSLKIESQSDVDALPDGPIYVTGDVKIKEDAAGVTLSHSIIAKGRIKIEAPNVTFNGDLLYSERKDIKIDEGGVVVNGTLYSPKDEVQIDNGNSAVTVNGRIVSHVFKIDGSNVTVDASSVSGSGGRRIKLIE